MNSNMNVVRETSASDEWIKVKPVSHVNPFLAHNFQHDQHLIYLNNKTLLLNRDLLKEDKKQNHLRVQRW